MRPVDEQQRHRAGQLVEGVVGHLAYVADTLRDARALEVGHEFRVVLLAFGGVGGYLLRTSVAAAVWINRHELDPIAKRRREHDRRAAPKRPDLDDPPPGTDVPRRVVQGARLSIGQPALDAVDQRQRALEPVCRAHARTARRRRRGRAVCA